MLGFVGWGVEGYGLVMIDVRKSTDDDLAKVFSWLQRQRAEGVSDSLFCNWELTEAKHHADELYIGIEGSTGEVVAYHWGELLNSGILEVRKDRRGHRVGSAMVKSSIARSTLKGACCLKVQCAPAESRLFWESMGFLVHDEKGMYAHRLLALKHGECPQDASLKSVEIRFYPEPKIYSKTKTIKAIREFTPKAWLLDESGEIQLAQRVAVFAGLSGWKGDPVLEVLVDGKRVFLDKAKRIEAEEIGVEEDNGAYFIDRLWVD